jgi:hypothetical protein
MLNIAGPERSQPCLRLLCLKIYKKQINYSSCLAMVCKAKTKTLILLYPHIALHSLIFLRNKMVWEIYDRYWTLQS